MYDKSTYLLRGICILASFPGLPPTKEANILQNTFVRLFVCHTSLSTHLGFVDCLVDLLHDPDELAAVDSLHKSIAHVLGSLRAER